MQDLKNLLKEKVFSVKKPSSIQQIVSFYFDLKGWGNYSKGFFLLNRIKFARYTRPAKKLLEITGGVDNSCHALYQMSAIAKEKGFDYGIETTIRWLNERKIHVY